MDEDLGAGLGLWPVADGQVGDSSSVGGSPPGKSISGFSLTQASRRVETQWYVADDVDGEDQGVGAGDPGLGLTLGTVAVGGRHDEQDTVTDVLSHQARSSQPLITWPTPIGNPAGAPWSQDASNVLPSAHFTPDVLDDQEVAGLDGVAGALQDACRRPASSAACRRGS